MICTLSVKSQLMSQLTPQSIIRDLTNIPERTQTRILAEKEVRTLHNQQDLGPDPRGPKYALLRSETAAISNYLDDRDVPLDDKGKPQLSIAVDAGVTLPKTLHFKPPGVRTIEPQSVQRACKRDEDIINAVREEEKELDDKQARSQLDWIDIQLPLRPYSKNWLDIAFCDEFHLGICRVIACARGM